MAKTKKTGKPAKVRPVEKDTDLGLPVDETGEPVVPDDDPDIIPSAEEELETTPPYEPPPPAEGP
ncbi:MAG TPA: hypothetical protein VFV68_17795 [Agriterribacter sp.]|nr:hypothetical protein [Agriterribacter sp.]